MTRYRRESRTAKRESLSMCRIMPVPPSQSQASPPSVLFLPGLLNDGRLFQSQIAALQDKGFLCQSITLDFADTIRGLGQGVLAKIEAFAPDHFSLVALSMGGYVAFEIIRQLAVRGEADRLKSLVLLNTQARPDSEATRIQREGLLKLAQLGRFKGVTPRLLPRLLGSAALADTATTDLIMRMAGDIGRDGFVTQQRAILSRIDSRPLLATITAPTLLIGGTEDRLTPPDALQEMTAKDGTGISNATLHILPGCGHLSPLERADEVTRLLVDFIANG